RSPPPPPLSRFSTPAVKDSAWASSDFMLGAGMVIIQKQTNLIVVLKDKQRGHSKWFFPRGRKDMEESLEQTALREAYEEASYHPKFIPLYNPTRQPVAPSQRELYNKQPFNAEPVYLTLTACQPKTKCNAELQDGGKEYLITWYAGQIDEKADRLTGIGMHNEQHYQSYLLPYDQALEKVSASEKMVLQYTWALYVRT
ncbi:hypothetical protein BDZ97DRAFT_1595983, partial [Flammula alnicola]